jgi:uncharacterized membrane protein YiaA
MDAEIAEYQSRAERFVMGPVSEKVTGIKEYLIALFRAYFWLHDKGYVDEDLAIGKIASSMVSEN